MKFYHIENQKNEPYVPVELQELAEVAVDVGDVAVTALLKLVDRSVLDHLRLKRKNHLLELEENRERELEQEHQGYLEMPLE